MQSAYQLCIVSLMLLLLAVGAVSAYPQEVIISEGRVLLQDDDGRFVEVTPKVIVEHESVKMGMSMVDARRTGILSKELSFFHYENQGDLLNNPVTVRYSFNLIDPEDDPVLTGIQYTFSGEIDRASFYGILEAVIDSLDGIPLDAYVLVPEQSIAFDYAEELHLNTDELDYAYVFEADGGKFNMKMQYAMSELSLQYDGTNYLRDEHIRRRRQMESGGTR